MDDKRVDQSPDRGVITQGGMFRGKVHGYMTRDAIEEQCSCIDDPRHKTFRAGEPRYFLDHREVTRETYETFFAVMEENFKLTQQLTGVVTREREQELLETCNRYLEEIRRLKQELADAGRDELQRLINRNNQLAGALQAILETVTDTGVV